MDRGTLLAARRLVGAAACLLLGGGCTGADARGAQVWALHQYLIGLRRRHPWLHQATTTALRLDNRRYIYQTRQGDEALVVALNIDATPLHVALAEFGMASAQVIAGNAAPAQDIVDAVDVEPHGWRILRPI